MNKRNELLVRIANLYYEHGLNQHEIAEICGIERSRISRLLLKARNLGYVQFNVVDLSENTSAISAKLEKQFQLNKAIIFKSLDVPDLQLKKAIGLIAADYLMSKLTDRDIFAISCGETVFFTIQGLEAKEPLNLTVLPAIGGSDLISPAYHVNEMVRTCVSKLGGISRTLYSPAFIDSKSTRDAILGLKDIKRLTELWNRLTMALVGIGKSPFEYTSRKDDGHEFGQFYLEPDEVKELLEMGVVGDINGRFINENGEELPAIVNSRIIGLSISDIKEVPLVIGVAGGLKKVQAIKAALTGKVINVLVTDTLTAKAIIGNEENK